MTLSITYLVSVVSAAVDRRSMARAISLSGETGVDIVLLHWDGDDAGSELSSLAQSLETQVLQVTQQHLAYPVLHHFHAASPAAAAPRALAALDDALLILSEGLERESRPPGHVLVRLRRTLEHYGETVGGTGGHDGQTPPRPDLAPLRRAGLPVVGDDEFARGAEEHALRRRRLHALVTSDAWSWPTASSAPGEG